MDNRNQQIKKLIQKLEKYTKEKQLDKYSDNCVIQDVIYFLGISLNEEEYGWHSGMMKFVNIVDDALEDYRKKQSPVNSYEIEGE
jgi:hypothetical protein